MRDNELRANNIMESIPQKNTPQHVSTIASVRLHVLSGFAM